MHSKPFRDLGGEQIAEQVFARRQAASASSSSGSLADDSVTNAKLANMNASTIKARKTASAGDPEDCTLSEVLDFVGSAAQGDILYRDSASWARLAAGTSGKFLKTQGAGANPLWDTPATGGVMYVGSTTLGANATAISISGLDLDTDLCYRIHYKLNNVAGVAVNWRLFFNSDTTTTNYNTCVAIDANSGYSVGASNTARCVDGPSGVVSSGIIVIKRDFDGRVRSYCYGSDSGGTAIRLFRTSVVWTTTGTNVTSLQLNCTTATGTGSGSKISVLKEAI